MNGIWSPPQLFKSLDQIDYVRILLIFVVAWLLISRIERVLPYLAERLPGRMRLYILPTVPLLRLLILLLTIGLIILQITKSSIEGLVAILGAEIGRAHV